jgi:hypothetical protein
VDEAGAPAPLDDATMDDLFREILASPSMSAPTAGSSSATASTPAVTIDGTEETSDVVGLGLGAAVVDAAGEEASAHLKEQHDMQQALWEWLPSVGTATMESGADALSALELDVSAWDFVSAAPLASEVF